MCFHMCVCSWQKMTRKAAGDQVPLMWDYVCGRTFSNISCGNVMQIIYKCGILKSKTTLTVLIAKVCTIIYNLSTVELEINCFSALAICSTNVNSTTFWILRIFQLIINCHTLIFLNWELSDVKLAVHVSIFNAETMIYINMAIIYRHSIIYC